VIKKGHLLFPFLSLSTFILFLFFFFLLLLFFFFSHSSFVSRYRCRFEEEFLFPPPPPPLMSFLEKGFVFSGDTKWKFWGGEVFSCSGKLATATRVFNRPEDLGNIEFGKKSLTQERFASLPAWKEEKKHLEKEGLWYKVYR
jgi:hypothetical protein